MKRTLAVLALYSALSAAAAAAPVALSPRDPGPARFAGALSVPDEALACFRDRLLGVYLPMGVTHERAAQLTEAYCGWDVFAAVDGDGDVSYVVLVRSGQHLRLYYTFAVVRP